MAVSRKKVLVLVMAIAALTAGAVYAMRTFLRTHAVISWGYTVEAQFTTLPSDDDALEKGLYRQPGVAGTILIDRPGDGKLRVHFIQARDGWGEPPIPDLDAACDSLGYAGRVHRFRDVYSERQTKRLERFRLAVAPQRSRRSSGRRRH